MRKAYLDRIPHLTHHGICLFQTWWHTFFARIYANWWGITLGQGCRFVGHPRFKKYPSSNIVIGKNCKFNSSPASNWIGVNRPCIISTLKPGAMLSIGEGSGFSGTVIACAKNIEIGNGVRCGANTLINDTDWHSNDKRVGPDAAVKIGDNAWLGTSVIVLKGVTIGQRAMIATGSIVTRSIPENTVAAGVPARIIRTSD